VSSPLFPTSLLERILIDKLVRRLLERKNALVARKEALLNISAQRQGKEESWDKQTEELAKVRSQCFQFKFFIEHRLGTGRTPSLARRNLLSRQGDLS